MGAGYLFMFFHRTDYLFPAPCHDRVSPFRAEQTKNPNLIINYWSLICSYIDNKRTIGLPDNPPRSAPIKRNRCTDSAVLYRYRWGVCKIILKFTFIIKLLAPIHSYNFVYWCLNLDMDFFTSQGTCTKYSYYLLHDDHITNVNYEVI